MEINNKYGYVPISSKSQESNSAIKSQKQQLIQNGIEEQNIFVEVGSGANEIKNRPVFQKLINKKLPLLLWICPLQFSGFNAKLFSSATLGRFDIHYSRKNKISDKKSVIDFFEKCHRKLNETNKNVSLQKNIKGLILKIGNRKSNHYSGIYQGKDFLKFEYEMKGRFLREYYPLLIENNLEEFENKLSKGFLYNFGKTLPLYYSYLDWLVVKLTPIRKQKFDSSALKLHYIQTMDFTSTIDRQHNFWFMLIIWIMKLTP